MEPRTIIDSHIHLWPATAANNSSHSWMEEGFILTKPHLLQDYYTASRQSTTSTSSSEDQDYTVQGVIYIETDRRLHPWTNNQPLTQWAEHPLEEIRFLRSIVEGQYGRRDADMLLGLVPWAPIDQGKQVFEAWLRLARSTAGEETWRRIKGFRSLLQGITDRAQFEGLVYSPGFSEVLRALRDGDREFVFDVGLSEHEGGVWQLEAFAEVLDRINREVEKTRQVTFILSMFGSF